jgi:hypothetical protein
LSKLKAKKNVKEKITILNNKEIFFMNLIYLKGIKNVIIIEKKDKKSKNKTMAN